MTKFETLKAEHQRLLDQHDAGGELAPLVTEAQTYIERVRVESENVADPRDRDQLRAYLRFWAAFLYDQSGTYPETSLRPASEMAKRPQIRWDWRWITAGVVAIFVVLVLLVILGPVIGSAFPDDPDFETPVGESPTETAASATRDMITVITLTEQEPSDGSPSTDTPTATVTSSDIPTPTNTPTLTETPEPHTATVAALQTQQVQSLSPTPTPLETENGSGESAYFYREQLMPLSGEDAEIAACTTRYVDVNLMLSDAVAVREATVPVWLNQAGDVRFALRSEVVSNQTTELDLGQINSTGDVFYLLHIEHPQYTTADVIFQLSQDCRSDRLTLEYELTEDWSYLEVEPDRNPDLALSWRLVTWGPEPLDAREKERWFAVLDLVGQGGDGNYIFWQADAKGTLSPLDGNRVIVRGLACQPSRTLVGLTSAGLAVTREILLQVPFCP